MTDAAIGTEATGCYECRECGYQITAFQLMFASYDISCPGCYTQTLSMFKYIPEDDAA